MDFQFDLQDSRRYERWRKEKLDNFPTQPDELITVLENAPTISAGERRSIQRSIDRANFAIYQCRRPIDRAEVRIIARGFGLERLEFSSETDEDGVTALYNKTGDEKSIYVPYSNKPLRWHTDGYYNPENARLRSFLLHCCSDADSGGENSLLDHEIAYIQLRDLDPGHIVALMAEDALTIPANTRFGDELRAESKGPVFHIGDDQRLHMRFTDRKVFAGWKNDPELDQARAALANILEASQFVFHHKLEPNQGIICNNVLHRRSGYSDAGDQTRLMYRIRSMDNVSLGLTD